MVRLSFSLLGKFQAKLDGQPFSAGLWPSPFAREFIQLFLVRSPHWVTVDELLKAGGPEMVLADVPAAIGQGRRVLGTYGALERRPDGAYRLLLSEDCQVDLAEFDRLARRARTLSAKGHVGEALMAAQEAEAHYKGELLEGNEAPWVHTPRRQVQERYLELLGHMADYAAVLSSYLEAVKYCRKALRVDPLREATYQRAMVYAYYLGDQVSVAGAYHACQQALTGAGRPVSPETVSVYERLITGEPMAAGLAEAAISRLPDGPGPN